MKQLQVEGNMTDTMQLRKQNSGGFGSSGSSQENLSNVMYNAANYNTIMVEYENGNREMAVDVPASFVAQVRLGMARFCCHAK